MAKRILVGYATITGSTKETAEAIAKELESRGLEAEARPLPEAGDLGRYDGFVIGAPVNAMAWHPGAQAFVYAHAEELAAKPVAFFLLSVAHGVGRGSLRKVVAGLLDPFKSAVAPIATGFFGGVMLKEPPLSLRLAFGIKKGAPLDGRNWDEIRAFAALVAKKMA
jgi:menaquinone-dependent protoporphyrinogen oxidase